MVVKSEHPLSRDYNRSDGFIPAFLRKRLNSIANRYGVSLEVAFREKFCAIWIKYLIVRVPSVEDHSVSELVYYRIGPCSDIKLQLVAGYSKVLSEHSSVDTLITIEAAESYKRHTIP